MDTKPTRDAQAEPQHVARKVLALLPIYVLLTLMFLFHWVGVFCRWAALRLADVSMTIVRWTGYKKADG